jgi:hypothetical protein
MCLTALILAISGMLLLSKHIDPPGENALART